MRRGNSKVKRLCIWFSSADPPLKSIGAGLSYMLHEASSLEVIFSCDLSRCSSSMQIPVHCFIHSVIHFIAPSVMALMSCRFCTFAGAFPTFRR
jgi:hypothetical protein